MVDVYEYPNALFPVASHSGKRVLREHIWLKFPLTVTSGYTFTKGKEYEFRFTRSGRDSIHYYYDSACGYGPYGQMIAPYPPVITPSYGLAMRCYGRMKPVSDVWRAVVNHGNDPAA